MVLGFSVYDLAAYFLIYSCLGWCVEVVYCAVTTGKIVNRGFLNGPVCPIYGFGMIAVLLLLTPLQAHFLPLYIGGVLLPSGIELVGGWALYKVYHTRWWDYSERPFNIGGFICLQFSLLWGVGAVIMVRVIHPSIALMVGVVPHIAGYIVMGVLYVVYAADLAATAYMAAGLTRDLDALEEVADSIHAVSDTMTHIIGTKALESDQRIGEGRLQLKLAAAEVRTTGEKLSAKESAARARELAQHAVQAAHRITDTAYLNASEAANAARLAAIGTKESITQSQRQHMEEMCSELLLRAEALQNHLRYGNALFGSQRLLRAFPQMKRGKNNRTLSMLREQLRKDKEEMEDKEA